jgi:hypothetical protein
MCYQTFSHLIHFIVQPTDDVMISMDSFADEAEIHKLLEIQTGIIYPQKTG